MELFRAMIIVLAICAVLTILWLTIEHRKPISEQDRALTRAEQHLEFERLAARADVRELTGGWDGHGDKGWTPR